MSAVRLDVVRPQPGASLGGGAEAGPSELVLEFSRADRAEQTHGFHFGPQEYLVRVGEGGVRSASFTWDEGVLGDLAALARGVPEVEAARRLGERMRRFLDELDWGGHEEVLQREGRKGELRLVVRSAAAELYALPWELVTLKDSGRHLADVPGCTLRYEWPREQEGLGCPGAVREGRVLLAWSEAGGGVAEERHLEALVKASQEGGFGFDMGRDVLGKVSLESLEKKLEEAQQAQQPVSVLHVLCHGTSLETTEAGLYGLVWNAPGDRGDKRLVDGGALGAVLAPYADTLRMVVLCACHGGDGGRLASLLGSVAQELHRVGIEVVVASRLPLSMEGSVLLAQTLYEKLLVESSSLEEALGAVRRRMRVAGRGFDWASLQLYARREGEADLRPVVLRPYRGLLAFGPKDRRFFFGRGRLEAQLLERVREAAAGRKPRFQVVAGASGAGKSSVVMAGLVPQLPPEEWEWLVVKPGELVRAGSQAVGQRSVVLRELRHRLHRVWAVDPLPDCDGASQQEVLEEVRQLRQARAERKLLLVMDQLEEVFTQLEGEERLALLRTVWALGKESELGCVVVATMRVDHFERCGEVVLEEGGARLDSVVYSEEHRLFVAQMGPEELAQAIEKPARKVGLELEAGLVDRLCEDVGQEPGALPLLEHALDLLWQRREGRRLTHRAYEEMEGVAGALTQTAERLFEELGEGERTQARRLLVRLVAVTDLGSPRAQGRVWVEEMRPREAGGRESFERVLEKLVRSRLVVKGGAAKAGEEDRGAWSQLAHETLLRRWKRLERWVAEDWEREQQLRELEGWAEDWEEHRTRADGGASYLLTGDRLGYARSLREKHGGELSPRSLRLLEESVATEARRQEEARAALEKERQTLQSLSEARARAARFFRRGFTVAAVLLVVAMVAALMAQTQRAKAQSTAQILLAEQLREEDPTKALLILREVDEGERKQKWLEAVMAVLQRPVARVVLNDYTGWLNSAAFSPDGSRVVTASRDRTARVWSAEGAPLAKLEGHAQGVVMAAFSPDGARVVTVSGDSVRVWSAEGVPLARMEGHAQGFEMAAFSPDGARVVTASEDGTARVWSAEGAPLARLEGHGAGVSSAVFSPDGERVVTASKDFTARVWGARGELVARLEDHKDKVVSAVFSPDGERVVTASKDGTARVWSAGGESLMVLMGHRGPISSATFSPDGAWVVTASEDGTARVWSTQGALMARRIRHGGNLVRGAFSPDGERVVTAAEDGTARVWSAEGALLARLEGHGAGVSSAVFSPDGERVVTASKDGTARVWSAGGALLARLEGHGGAVHSAAFSPDGERVVTASQDGTARVWSTGGALLARLEGHGNYVQWAAFSPDGKRVVTASPTKGMVRVWSAGGALLASLEGHGRAVSSAVFSPDGERVVTSSWDARARVWSVGGELLAELNHNSIGVNSAAFSPDGERVVTASMDGVATVWSVRGELLTSLMGHRTTVWSAAFSPDGERVVTASWDETARVWSAGGELLVRLMGHHGLVWSAVFSPDGERVLTASGDGTAQVWPVTTRLGMRYLETATRGCLDAMERQTYLDETLVWAMVGHVRCQHALSQRH